jgi:hypothetical protein
MVSSEAKSERARFKMFDTAVVDQFFALRAVGHSAA